MLERRKHRLATPSYRSSTGTGVATLGLARAKLRSSLYDTLEASSAAVEPIFGVPSRSSLTSRPDQRHRREVLRRETRASFRRRREFLAPNRPRDEENDRRLGRRRSVSGPDPSVEGTWRSGLTGATTAPSRCPEIGNGQDAVGACRTSGGYREARRVDRRHRIHRCRRECNAHAHATTVSTTCNTDGTCDRRAVHANQFRHHLHHFVRVAFGRRMPVRSVAGLETTHDHAAHDAVTGATGHQ